MRTILLVHFILLYLAPAGLWGGEHGREQLAEFVRERPAAGALLLESLEIAGFLRKPFAGACTSVPPDWHPAEPRGNAYAENTPNEKGFARIVREASLGRVSREEFIREILRLEHQKMKETRNFLATISLSRDQDSAQTQFYRKMLATPEGFEEFLAYLQRIKRPDDDVFAMYSKFYDFLAVTSQRRKAEMNGKAGGRG